jgi:hypothetical protein
MEDLMSSDPHGVVQITVDAGTWQGELAHNWNYIGKETASDSRSLQRLRESDANKEIE